MARKWRGWVGVTLAAAGVVAGGYSAKMLRGDEPSRLGRLFRGASASKPDTPPPASSSGLVSGGGSPLMSARPASSSSSMGGGSSTRLVPQPRNSRAATEAEPLVTRVSIGRSDDGKQFCMFLQVFADGTVLDSEGVHKVAPDLLRPIAQVLQGGDLARLKGHCGGPPADFIEQVHMIAYDHSLGRLRANSFSFSGNPQGCDPSVKTMNAAMDAIQAKLSGSSPMTSMAPTSAPLPPSDPQPLGLSPR